MAALRVGLAGIGAMVLGSMALGGAHAGPARASCFPVVYYGGGPYYPYFPHAVESLGFGPSLGEGLIPACGAGVVVPGPQPPLTPEQRTPVVSVRGVTP